MKIGILTGGGDTAALNATLYGVAANAEKLGHTLIGFRYGWKGVIDPLDCVELTSRDVPPSGGTVLRTSRTKLKEENESLEQALNNISKTVDAFIAVGGDDTLSVAAKAIEKVSLPFAVITKTIDNDLGKNALPNDESLETMINYFTPGFPTAVQRIKEYTSQLKTTAYSHERVIVLEAMGRMPGWLALASGISRPDAIVIPEVALDFELLKEKVRESYNKIENGAKRNYSIIVVAEGAKYIDGRLIAVDESNIDAFGHAKLGGAAEIIAQRLQKELSGELGTKNFNSVVPGYLYRSGSPSKTDRQFCYDLGEEAVRLVTNGCNGYAAIVQKKGDELYVRSVPVSDLVNRNGDGTIKPRLVNSAFYDSVAMNITPLGLAYFDQILDGKSIRNAPR